MHNLSGIPLESPHEWNVDLRSALRGLLVQLFDSIPNVEQSVATQGNIKIRDSEVVLYQRAGSGMWQARYKLPDGTWHRISTKRSNLTEAKRIAGEAYDQARFRQKEGLVVVPRRFRDVAKTTANQLQTLIDSGEGKVAYKDYIQAINNHLIPFFGAKHIDKITQDVMREFEAWRVKKLGKKPAASTIMNHNAALLRVFDTALQNGWISQKSIPVTKNKGVKAKRRPDFTLEEWRRVTANLRHWINQAKDERTRNMRELLQDYVLVLSNTGIRTGVEANAIRWKHIRWHQDKGDRYLIISVNGKTGERELVARRGCEVFLQRIQSRFPDIAKMSFDELLKASRDEHVFRLRDTKGDDGKTIPGKQTKNLYHTFNQFLTEHKLLKDKQGNTRSLYSLRHMYATMRLMIDKVPHHDLAKQLGTSIAMIEKHYSHLKPIMVAGLLAGKKFEKKPK